MQIRGAVAVVTGASSGIGRETALALAGKGARLVLAARRAAELEETADDCRKRGGDCRSFECDAPGGNRGGLNATAPRRREWRRSLDSRWRPTAGSTPG